MEKTDWEKFFMEVFNLLFEEKTAEAIQVIEKQRLAMGLPALNENEREMIYRHQNVVERICISIVCGVRLERTYIELETELNLLDAKLKRWKYIFLFFSRNKINAKRKELQDGIDAIREELQTPQAPEEWRFTRTIYEELASLFRFNQEWVDKIANISQIVDSFQARLIK